MNGSSIVLPSPEIERRESLLKKKKKKKKKTESPAIPRQRPRKKIGEVAGGAAAECAAVCCCCPCVLIDLVVLTVYRVPAGLWRKKKLRRQDAALLQRPSTEAPSLTEAAGQSDFDGGDCASESTAELEAAEAMERDAWAHFYGTGFWRSPSQNERRI